MDADHVRKVPGLAHSHTQAEAAAASSHSVIESMMAILKCRAVCGTQAGADVWGTMGLV